MKDYRWYKCSNKLCGKVWDIAKHFGLIKCPVCGHSVFLWE